MTKRPSLRAHIAPIEDEAELATERVKQIQAGQGQVAGGDRVAMTTSTIHLPAELLEALQQAALRRAARRRRADTSGKGRGGRPSVSEIVVDLLTRHREELDGMD